MKILTFSGETSTQALKKAQLECGENAVVISTKQIKKKMINSPALFEIVVAVEDENKEQNKKQQVPFEISEAPAKQTQNSNDVYVNISNTAKQISKIANVVQENVQTTMPVDELNAMKKEIAKLSDKLTIVSHMIWDENAPKRNYLEIPPEFSQIYQLALQSGMSCEHLDEIMRLTIKHMPMSMKNNSVTVKRFFQVLLRKMIPTRKEMSFHKGEQKIMMFIGPTGVGKTTTLAKLAGRYAYMCEKRQKVGIITLDTYRIGAVEQLFQYAKMMHLPIEDVVDVNDFETALRSFRNCDIVLIDTVGSSPNDKDKLLTLDTLLRQSSVQIDVSLVLSAGTKLQDLKNIYKNYSFLDVDTLIFTKFDETQMFGNVFSLIYEVAKPVSYISVGQSVPDDLYVANSEFIISCIMDGFGKQNDTKSSK